MELDDDDEARAFQRIEDRFNDEGLAICDGCGESTDELTEIDGDDRASPLYCEECYVQWRFEQYGY